MSRSTKRFLHGWFVLTSVTALFNAAGLYAQIVTNGGFESSDTGSTTSVMGWVIQYDSTITPPPQFIIEGDTVEQGDRALEVIVHGLGSEQYSIQAVADSLHVKPGATYDYSVWARSENAGAEVNFTVGNYSYAEYKAIRPAVLTTQWTKYTMQFTVNDNQTVIRAPIHFNYAANTDNAVYIDDLQIQDVNAAKEPVIVQAESGKLGSGISIGADSANSITYITPDTNYTGFVPGDSSRIATYQITFPDSGHYSLYARVRVGPATYNSNSFFYGNGFGKKNDTASADWVFVSGLASAGFTDSSSFVDGPGLVGPGVWKWVDVTKNTYQGSPGDSFYVSVDSLTRTFQAGTGGSGLEIDKFAFARSNLYFTVWDLDNGLPGTANSPADFWKGPALAVGQGKFLGCAYAGVSDNVFANYWTQLTPEDAGKWGSVADTSDTTLWNWSGLDKAYNYAQTHHLIFKDHNLIWGQQQPSWISDLDSAQQIKYITTWIRMVGERYPKINMVDVVNEPLNNPPDGGGSPARANYINALGGAGSTGWDWVINAFKLAREYLPNAKLLINDYGILNSTSATSRYIKIINLLKDKGLINGIGVQGHRFTLENADTNLVKQNLASLGATGLPVYVSELDLGNINNTGTPDDNTQLQLYEKIFPVLWNSPAVKGITFWGYLEGYTWQSTCYLVRSDGSSRPALQWIAQYVKDHPTGIESKTSTLPTKFSLDQNYPNPFNPTTTIRYQIPATSRVSLKVYDVLGREVATLVDARQSPGSYRVTFNAGKFASGVYFYELRTDNNSSFKKMMLLK